jgi:hypothetical protein
MMMRRKGHQPATRPYRPCLWCTVGEQEAGEGVASVKRVRLVKLGDSNFAPWHVSRPVDEGRVTVCRPNGFPFQLDYTRWELVPVKDLLAWRLCAHCVRTIRAANKRSATAPQLSSSPNGRATQATERG